MGETSAPISRTLTSKQAAFIAEYVKDGNATRSAIAAGYSPASAHVTAHYLLRHPKIVPALAEVRAAASKLVSARLEKTLGEAIGTAAWVLEQSVQVQNEARAAKQYGAAVSALTLIAKPLPEFRDGPIVDNSQHVHLPAGLTVDELRQLASGT